MAGIQRTLHPESQLAEPLAAGVERFISKADGSIVHQIGNAGGEPVTVSGSGSGLFKAFRLDVALGHFNETSSSDSYVYEWDTDGANSMIIHTEGDPISSIQGAAEGAYEAKTFALSIEDDVDGTYPGNLLLTFTVPGDRRGRVIVTSDPTWASGVFFAGGAGGMEPHVSAGIRSATFAAGQTTVTLGLYSSRKTMEAESGGLPAMTGYLTRLFIHVF